MIDSNIDPNNLSDDDIRRLMASGVDMSQLAALYRKSGMSHEDEQNAIEQAAAGVGGRTVNGLYLPNTGGAIVNALRAYKAKKEAGSNDEQIQSILANAKDSSGDYINKGVLGRTGLPTDQDSLENVQGPDTQALANMPSPLASPNPQGPAAPQPQGSVAGGPNPTAMPPSPAVVQMMQALALRKKKLAALPGNTLDPSADSIPDNIASGYGGSGALY